MRTLFALLVIAAALAQQPPAQPPQSGATPPAVQQTAGTAQTSDQAKPPEQSAPPKSDAKAAAPESSGERWFTGSFDVGYRWVTNVDGSLATYRSVVNLGQGPKLTDLNLTIFDPKHRLFDRMDARANGWGGDPYNTAHIDLQKRGLWQLSADYRNIAYFNALPSYANPFAPAGFNQQMFDTQRRNGYVNLQFFPGRHIVPYLAFERNSGYGHGVSTWVEGANDEFAVPALLRDSTNNYRGGVRFEFNRYHLTLEQGGTTFKQDDQAAANGLDYGDRTTSIFGGTQFLNTLQEAYGIRGTSVYSKVLASASPFSWVDLYGQFLWSEPKTSVRYFDNASGNFALASALLLYGGQFDLGNSNANAPHVLGNAGFEIRPWRRLRIIDSWTTDRYHGTGFGALTEQILLTPSSGPALLDALNTRQVVNYNQEQVEAVLDVSRKITLRAGYRYVWGDATVGAGALDPAGPLRGGELQRNVALAGVTIRPWQKLLLNADYEGASTSQDYFRTGLYNYNRMRARARYQATGSIWLQANFAVLDNQNPTPGIQYDFRSRDNSLSVYWTPNGGKRISVMAEYDRSTLRSNVDFLLLPFLTPAVSAYRENGHTATSAVDVILPKIGGMAAKLTVGGSFFVSAGTNATQYYQPLGRFSLPLQKHLQWNTEWRWYGFGENYYQYQAFRAHIFMTGIRVER